MFLEIAINSMISVSTNSRDLSQSVIPSRFNSVSSPAEVPILPPEFGSLSVPLPPEISDMAMPLPEPALLPER